VNRRTFVITTAAAVAAAGLGLDSRGAEAQDLEFIAALERAQRERPMRLGSRARIAPESEPGTRLVVHGRAVAEDGNTPLGGAVIFAYHTDRAGLYDRPGAGAHSWRLKGWALTDKAGVFEFRTIRPGAYPRRNTPEHVHLNIFLPDGRRYWANGVVFDDDPLLPADDRRTAVHVRHEGGEQHVDFTFQLFAKNRF
jgi:protocatechuate 3,4-dioxygenase beta subunit